MFVTRDERTNAINGVTVGGVFASLALLLSIIAIPFCLETVEQGTVKVGYVFGKYVETLEPGGPYAVNPLASWKEIDTKEKTLYLEDIPLPSHDQLVSTVDLSIQYRAIGGMADMIVSGTGSEQAVVDVHLVPNVKNLLRQAGRGVATAEDLFDDATVAQMSAGMLSELAERMSERGFTVSNVLVRHIDLPPFINAAIQKKKERQQLAEQQTAELERFETEQQQKIKTATAERDAAVLAAEQIRTLADAKAYEIEKVNEAAAKSPMYLQLEAVKAFGQLGADPSSKIIIMDGSSARPFPFLNLGEGMVPGTGNVRVK